MKTDQQNPNFGQTIGPRQLTTDTSKPPVNRSTAADAARVRAAVQAKARAVAGGRDTYGPRRSKPL